MDGGLRGREDVVESANPALDARLERRRRALAPAGSAIDHQKDDPDPKAISCYGLYLPEFEETWLRFVDGRPVGRITTRFLSWCSEKLVAAGKRVLVLVWDNASWHKSKEVRRWIGEHNREVKKGYKEGVRIIGCLLSKQSAWLYPIEPKWVHGKSKVVDPDGLLSAYELADRV
jgi:hypothetical protein